MKLIRNSVLASLGIMFLTGCHAFKDDLPNCPKPMAEIKFSYTMNMALEDRFAESVHCIDLYVFRVVDNANAETKADGKTTQFVAEYHEDNNDVIRTGKLTVTMELAPGDYQAVVYGGMSCSQSSFDKLFTENENLTVDDLQVALNTNYYFDDTDETGDPTDDDIDRSALELHDHFFGIASFSVYEQTTTPVTIDVMKNTNTIHVKLKNDDGSAIDPEEFRMYIVDDNNFLDSDNEIFETGAIAYRPYFKDFETPGELSTMKASFNVSKLHKENDPRLIVLSKTRIDKQLMIDQHLMSGILAAKDAFGTLGSQMDDQEFLDRNDEWEFTFTIDTVKNTWLSLTIKVNDWEVRFDNFEAE